MLLNFYKYSAAGNDFVLIDLRQQKVVSLEKHLAVICQRQNGIGADGVLLIEDAPHANAQFKMRYYNADGKAAAMCGNGARTVAYYTYTEQDFSYDQELCFQAWEQDYFATWQQGQVQVLMTDCREHNAIDLDDFGLKSSFFVNTGVPHAVFEVDSAMPLAKLDVKEIGSRIRHDPRFPEGSNVTFWQAVDLKASPAVVTARVYERGVEDETLSCGTGAMAIGQMLAFKAQIPQVQVQMPGGTLEVKVSANPAQGFLRGPVRKIFTGQFILED
jgi:diaminopimelate epimerase